MQWAFTADSLFDSVMQLVVCCLIQSEWHIQLASSVDAATAFLRVCAARIVDRDRQGRHAIYFMRTSTICGTVDLSHYGPNLACMQPRDAVFFVLTGR
jgi:hypothetical protein